MTYASGVFLQRKCACDGKSCDSCRKPVPQRSTVPAIVHNVLRSPGSPLDSATRTFLEPRFGRDFSHVRVHADGTAARSADAVSARAYTVGRDVVLGSEYASAGSRERLGLLAHELTHVAQQRGASAAPAGLRVADDPALEGEAESNAASIATGGVRVERVARSGHMHRAPKTLGTKFTHTSGKTSAFTKITAAYDGRNFILDGDGTELMNVSAQSGRPITVRAADAKRCKGDPADSYLNNPRYVGVTDNGPIPEGTYKFSAARMMTFSAFERAEMLLGGDYLDPFGGSLHGGDWGAGRVALTPSKIVPSKFCGNTTGRSGFYLHGGILAGSSGCIDIGNSAFSDLTGHLDGYRSPVTVTVKYLHAAPSVGMFGRALGRFTYPSTTSRNPSLWDRLGSVFEGDD
jgi:Domain of unknown function (DUF4157)/Protein of unknown function (DUF2778)